MLAVVGPWAAVAAGGDGAAVVTAAAAAAAVAAYVCASARLRMLASFTTIMRGVEAAVGGDASRSLAEAPPSSRLWRSRSGLVLSSSISGRSPVASLLLSSPSSSSSSSSSDALSLLLSLLPAPSLVDACAPLILLQRPAATATATPGRHTCAPCAMFLSGSVAERGMACRGARGAAADGPETHPLTLERCICRSRMI